jgi:hypothetical protein
MKLDGPAFASASNFAVSALIFSWSAFSFASTFAKPSSGFSDV